MTFRITATCLALSMVACNGDSDQRSLDSYDEVENRSSASAREDATYDEMKDGDVDVYCSGDSTARLETRVDKGVLIIEGSDTEGCEVVLPGRYVTRIVVKGNGELRSDGDWEDVALVDIRGGGKVDLDHVRSDDLEVKSTGHASYRLLTCRPASCSWMFAAPAM